MTMHPNFKARKIFENTAADLGIAKLPSTLWEEVYHPLAKWIALRQNENSVPFILGVNGAQGSGKSTFCALLSPILRNLYGLRCAVLSIDDVYHTREFRLDLARRIHPLCAIRGVPGTHDIHLANEVFDALLRADADNTVRLPRFDKAKDDRRPVDAWDTCSGPVDVLLFEGWCVGCPPLPTWNAPYNDREQRDDPKGVWAQWSQQCLATDYQELFSRLDALLMIKVPSMETVRTSRWLQEEKLWQAHESTDLSLVGLMTQEEVFDYVALFARHTEYMLEALPARADRLILRDHDFAYRLSTQQMNL